jgi:hypothetical protein
LTPPSRHREPHHAANLSRRRDDQQPPPGLPETGPPGPDERNHSPHSATGGTTPNPTTNGCLRRPHRHRARRPASRPSGRSAVGLRPSLDPARRARHATSDRKQPKHEPANPLTGPAPSGMTCGNAIDHARICLPTAEVRSGINTCCTRIPACSLAEDARNKGRHFMNENRIAKPRHAPTTVRRRRRQSPENMSTTESLTQSGDVVDTPNRL